MAKAPPGTTPELDEAPRAVAIDASGSANVLLGNTVIGFGGEGYRYGGEYGNLGGESVLAGRVLCSTRDLATLSNSGAYGNFTQDASCNGPATANLGLSRARFTRGNELYFAGAGGPNYSREWYQASHVYHAPVFESPLLSAGSPVVCGTSAVGLEDQRGRDRGGESCDSGAIEAAIGSVVVNTSTDTPESIVPNCSLRDALLTTASSGGEGGEGGENGVAAFTPREAASCQGRFDITTITFDDGVFPSDTETPIVLSYSLPYLSSTVSIEGPGKDALTIDGNQNEIFSVYNGNIYLSDMTLTGAGGGEGGELDNVRSTAPATYVRSGVAVLDSVVVTGNSGERRSGALSFSYSQVSISNSTISNNQVSEDGAGGIRVRGRALTRISNSTISGNVGQDSEGESTGAFGRYAGGIYIGGNNLTVIRNSTITGNTSARTGGGIGVRNGRLFLLNSTVTGNSADQYGAGLYVQNYESKYQKYDASASAYILNSIISGNRKGNGVYSGGEKLGVEITLASWDKEGPGDPRAPSDPVEFYQTNNVLGDSYNGYQTAFYSVSDEASVLDLQGSFVATATDGANAPNPNSTPLKAIINALDDNGGMTLTHSLLQGSPAIDGGDRGLCSGDFFDVVLHDQIGNTRQGVCDIGSVEFIDSACFVVLAQNGNAFTFCL